jgi:hypothetical protein
MASGIDKETTDRQAEEKISVPADSANSDSEAASVTGINEKSLLRKIDINLLPAVGILYLFSFLDRSNGKNSHPELSKDVHRI